MTFAFNWKTVITLVVLCIVVLCAVDYICWPAKADDSSAGIVFTYGSNYNYSVNVLPNNSYVHQGENISQGNYYDLSGVYGFSGVLAWWKDQWTAGTTYPEKTFDLNILKLHSVYIDPATWPVGKYYQFDGAMSGSNESGGSYFGNGNCYVFYVTKPSENWTAPTIVTNVTRTGEIEVNIGGNITKVQVTYTDQVTGTQTPVPTNTPLGQHTVILPTTAAPEPTNPDVVDKYGNPVNNAPANLNEVTPTPVPIGISVIAMVFAAAFVVWRKRK